MDGRGLMEIWTKDTFQEYVDERLADLTRVGVTATALDEETPRWVYSLEELHADTKKAAKAKRRREARARAEAERRQRIEDEKRRARLKGTLLTAQQTALQHAPALGAFSGAGKAVSERREAVAKAAREADAKEAAEAAEAARAALAIAEAPAPAAELGGEPFLPPVAGATPRSPDPPAPPEAEGHGLNSV